MTMTAKIMPLAGFVLVAAAAWAYLLNAGMALVMNSMVMPTAAR